jgi:hypothetical protein
VNHGVHGEAHVDEPAETCNEDRSPYSAIRFFVRTVIYRGLGKPNSIQKGRTNRRFTEKGMLMKKSFT